MLAELFSWWLTQMSDIARAVSRRASNPVPDALVVARDSDSSADRRLFRRRRGVMKPLAELADNGPDVDWRQAFAQRRRGEPVVIALDQPFLLRQTSVPAVAASSLERLLGYEMDRLTPFPAGDVMFSHRVLPGGQAGGKIQVEVAVVPKAWVQDLLDRLAGVSILPTALEAAGPDQVIRRITMNRASPAQLSRVRLVRWLATAACVTLAAAVIATPIARQSLALAEMEERITLLQPRMDEVNALRARITAGSAGAGQLAAARDRGTAALRVLGVLTDLLPDDTYLTNLVLRPRQLTMEGRSAAATKLITSLTAESYLKNPSFAAPVVRGDNGMDIFTIQAGFGS